MDIEQRQCSWDISDYYFRVLTESVRLLSNRVHKFVSVAEAIESRVDVVGTFASDYEPESLRKHLEIIPTDGDIAFEVTILETSYDAIDASIPDLEELLGVSLSFASAVSLLMFDLIVKENATHFLTKFNLMSDDANAYAKAAIQKGSNVAPIR